MFVKTFPHLSAEQVAQASHHAQAVADALRGCPDVIFPEILGYDEHSISYSRVDCSVPLPERLRALTLAPADLHKAGRILRRIHDAGGRHGDYVPHNLFMSGNHLVLVDPHLPDYLPFDPAIFSAPTANEVARFAFVLMTDQGLKRSIRHFGYQRKMVRAFLDGYGAEKDRPPALLRPLLVCAAEVYNLKRRAGLTAPIAFAHCALACLLTYSAATGGNDHENR